MIELDVREVCRQLGIDDEKFTVCQCNQPNGFVHVANTDTDQIWRHVRCGGLVVRGLIKTK